MGNTHVQLGVQSLLEPISPLSPNISADARAGRFHMAAAASAWAEKATWKTTASLLHYPPLQLHAIWINQDLEQFEWHRTGGVNGKRKVTHIHENMPCSVLMRWFYGYQRKGKGKTNLFGILKGSFLMLMLDLCKGKNCAIKNFLKISYCYSL